VTLRLKPEIGELRLSACRTLLLRDITLEFDPAEHQFNTEFVGAEPILRKTSFWNQKLSWIRGMALVRA
jgi:hypothetical protein